MHVSINNDLCKTKPPPQTHLLFSPGYRQIIIKKIKNISLFYSVY